MAPSWLQILIVVVLLVLLFGRNKISDLMGDVARGIKSFKKGIQEDGEETPDKTDDTVKTIEHEASDTADASKDTAKSKAKG
ncbi:twin-arginine translocase TatA/TatE family subunit [Kaustia mangrovi]|uniref:Sec-independent protein translocase protein TatA n=1 Tax=Kaustia mangrovi TaxID=2593653 RepID=A0A7S8HAK5_9HYPH|nr:twin-arginine translocase TatA/TatE family subunit [Kaustia mangrovi]QPC41682.1 twin-arginine translocase TatA/TatE family subunit [Kaustia mangrovi]